MGKDETYTMERIVIWTLILTVAVVLVAVLQHCKRKESGMTVPSESDVNEIEDSGGGTVDEGAGVDANAYDAEAEKRVTTKAEVKQYKKEMSEIDAARQDELIERYSLGYILFYADSSNAVIPYESRLKIKCELILSKAQVVSINDKGILMDLPMIQCPGAPIVYRSNWAIRRQAGYQTPIFGHPGGIRAYLEMLVDHGDRFVCVLGFTDASSGKEEKTE
jgi:hypothetical protein